MSWVTWLQYRYQGALAAALLAVLAVLLLVTGLHAAQVWHLALAGCAHDGSCASLPYSQLSLASPRVYGLVVATGPHVEGGARCAGDFRRHRRDERLRLSVRADTSSRTHAKEW